MKDGILLTGATGSLGSEILRALLTNGHRVFCLARSKGTQTAHERIWRGEYNPDAIRTFMGDIREPLCGVSGPDHAMLTDQVGTLLHCAASIGFQDEKAAHVTNVTGVQNVLNLAQSLGVNNFQHISTAYVGGDAQIFSERDAPIDTTHRPRNNYELTKQIGEMLVRDWALGHPPRSYSIYRPSILVGRADGTSPTFDGYYGFFRPLHNVAHAMRRKAKAARVLPPGVTVTSDTVHLPLVIRAHPLATLNLVPIDWTANTISTLVPQNQIGKTFHLVNPDPPLVRQVIATSLAYLKITGVQVVGTRKEKEELVGAQSPVIRRLQERIDQALDQYTPYTNHPVSISMEEPQRTLGARYVPVPTVDDAYLHRLLRYALDTNWDSKEI